MCSTRFVEAIRLGPSKRCELTWNKAAREVAQKRVPHLTLALVG